MLFKEAVSKRIYELCETYNFTPNKLAEMSAVAPSTLQDMLSLKVNKPNAYVIYLICKTLKNNPTVFNTLNYYSKYIFVCDFYNH